MLKFLHLFIIPVLLLSITSSYAQGPKGSGNSAINSVPSQVRNDTCLDKKFSVVVYLINDSVYSLTTPSTSAAAIASYSLTQCFTKLNATFSAWCISFEHCRTVVIPNHTYNDWNARRNGVNAIAEYNTVNTICLYVPIKMIITNMYDPTMPSYGYNADTVAPYKNAIVCTKSGLGLSSFFHAFGMFFGLPHTYVEINPGSPTIPPTPAGIASMEFVNKSNSLIHGDGFSDTEADPFPLTSGPNLPPASTLDCAQLNLKDANGDYYTPPFDNYMSHYLSCSCKYSQQQYLAMVHYIMKKRLYLH